jgi:hypothetical protein
MARPNVFLIALIMAAATQGWAGEPYDDETTSEGWAWAQIRTDQFADFTARCGQPEFDLDPDAGFDWSNPCRRIPAQFLADILTEARLRDRVPQHGVRLRGANIAGGIDLTDTEINAEVRIEVSRIESDVTLDDSHWKRPLSLQRSTVAGGFSAERIHTDSAILLDNALFDGGVDLGGARVNDDLQMSRSFFDGPVNLTNAKVGGDLYVEGSYFGGEVTLTNARIDHSDFIEEASFADKVSATGLNVGDDLFMRFETEFGGKVFLIGARIGGFLELRAGAKAWFVDLSGAEAAELQIDGLKWWCADGKPLTGMAHNRVTLGKLGSLRCEHSDGADLPEFILRNVHVGAFQDDPDAWPPLLDLEGFRYDRVGGIAGVDNVANRGRADMRQRKSDEWTDWLARDPIFSSQPYSQLSSVLVAAGNRDRADDIQFAGRERERDEVWNHSLWSWTRLSLLSIVAGYGIGSYTFRVLWWVFGRTVSGAALLWFSPNARRHGLFWRLGASLHRLLPVIELNKEFKDFFDNAATDGDLPPNLNRVQAAYFAAHALAGWILGFFLIAAMSGLTQKT